MAKILDGKKIAFEIRENLRNEIKCLNIVPRLDVILIGEHLPSEVYVKAKIKACEEVGILGIIHRFKSSCSENKLKNSLVDLNHDTKVHGILVQLPMPSHINQFEILQKLSPSKDVDCFHPINLGQLFHQQQNFLPCTSGAVMSMLDYYTIPVIGKHIAIINDSILLGRPLSALLTNRGATVTVCNKHTENLSEITSSAEIIVVAVGKRPQFILNEKYCKKDCIIIDCGINKCDGVVGKVVGDVDVESVRDIASMLSVVPGGIGPITISILLSNVLKAAKEIYATEMDRK